MVILDFAGTETEAAIAGLRRVFGVDETTASNLVAHLPKSVQRGVPRVRAEYFRRALELIGARVEIRTPDGGVVEPEPSSDPATPEPTQAPAAEQPPVDATPPPATVELGAWSPEPPREPARKPDDGRTIGPGARSDGASTAAAPPPAAARTLPEAVPAPVLDPPGRAPRDPSLPPAVDEAVADPLPSEEASDPPAAPGGRREPTYVPSPDALRPDEEPGGLQDPSLHSANPFDDDSPQTRAPETVREPMIDRFGEDVWEPSSRSGDEPQKPRERRPPPQKRPREGRAEPARPAGPAGAAAGRAAGAIAAAGALAASAGAALDEADDEPMLGTRPPLGDARRDDGAGPVGVHPGALEGIASEPPELRGVEVDGRSFWAAIPDALVLPFAGRGVYWVLAVGMWSVVVAVLGLLGSFVPILGAIVYFFAYTSLLAFACDYFRVCMWAPPTGETELDRSPETDPALILNNYIKKGLHLSAFSMVSQIPLLWWVMEHLVELDLMGILTSPITWLLAALPSFYWPMGVAMTALGHDFSRIWYVTAGFRVIVQVPLQYLAAVAIGYAAFGLSWVFLALFGSFLGLAGSILAGTVGLPLGICHGLFGSLIGHILRAHPEAFE